MILIENHHIIAFDVDETLVSFSISGVEDQCIEVATQDFSALVLPIKEHVEMIRNSKVRGHFVVVWSQGGYEWAKAVVDALGVTEYVDLICEKPRWYVDDIPANEWMLRIDKRAGLK